MTGFYLLILETSTHGQLGAMAVDLKKGHGITVGTRGEANQLTSWLQERDQKEVLGSIGTHQRHGPSDLLPPTRPHLPVFPSLPINAIKPIKRYMHS